MLKLLVLGFAVGKPLVKGLAFDMAQNVVNGGDAHFYTGITFPQQLDGILFDHSNSSVDKM
jgi:hypothetical protein